MLHKGYEIMGFGIAITGDKNLYATHEFMEDIKNKKIYTKLCL